MDAAEVAPVGEWPGDEMENPHWCRCGWQRVAIEWVWERCQACGYTGIPVDSVADACNLLHAFDGGDTDWGPFWWHPATHVVVRRDMDDRQLTWAVECGDRSWMELVSPALLKRLPRLTPDQVADLLSNASDRWRAWLIAHLSATRA